MIGLSFRETMSGGYHLSGAPGLDRPMSFTVGVKARSLREALLGTPVFDIRGMVTAEGFADHKALDGTLLIDPLRRRELAYDFRFEGNDGHVYTFRGKKDLSEGHLVQAMTVLPGALLDASGAEVGQALLRFDLRSDIVKFLRSFRLVRS